MKFLFDQNLSRKLAHRLSDLFPGSAHVRDFDLERASDLEIWDFARAKRFCVVSLDADFAERSKLFGSPPKVAWLRCGNTPPATIERILRDNAQLLEELNRSEISSFVELF